MLTLICIGLLVLLGCLVLVPTLLVDIGVTIVGAVLIGLPFIPVIAFILIFIVRRFKK